MIRWSIRDLKDNQLYHYNIWGRTWVKTDYDYEGYKTKRDLKFLLTNHPYKHDDYRIEKTGTNKDTRVEDGKVKDNIGIPICRGDLLMPVQSSCTALNVRTCTVLDILKTPSGLIKIISDITTFLLKNSPRIVVTPDILKTFENLADRYGD